jgi:hypothetical protein
MANHRQIQSDLERLLCWILDQSRDFENLFDRAYELGWDMTRVIDFDGEDLVLDVLGFPPDNTLAFAYEDLVQAPGVFCRDRFREWLYLHRDLPAHEKLAWLRNEIQRWHADGRPAVPPLEYHVSHADDCCLCTDEPVTG